MIKDIKALAADIDMTLTAKGAALPEPTIWAFRMLHERGVKLGLATGREIAGKLYTQGIDWKLGFEFDFIIGMNGGMIYDAAKKSLWSTDLLTKEEMSEILTAMLPLIDKYEISVNAEGGGNHNAMYIRGELLDSARRHGFDFIDKTDDIAGFCDHQAYKLLFRSDPEYEGILRKTLNDNFHGKYAIFGTYPGTVEIMRNGIDKGSGLKRYCADNNIPLENVIAFGDNENDNTLLEDAGWGVCLKDGSEGTKKCADDITDYDCEEAGVGFYLFDHYLRQKMFDELDRNPEGSLAWLSEPVKKKKN